MAKITVLGAGAFGTAIATLLSANNHKVMLWCHEQSVADDILTRRCNNRFLPGVSLCTTMRATNDLQAALAFSSDIFVAVPVKFLRGVLMQIICSNHTFIMLSKGIEQETLFLPTQVLSDVCQGQPPVVVISGPNFAQEIAQGVPTATSVASADKKLAYRIARLVGNSFFNPFITDDSIGVQVGGALKNVMSLATGLLSGAGYGENTRSFLLTRGYAELVKIAMVLGGRQDTLYGLSGLGDLILTATGSLSRNVRVGKMIGNGMVLDEIAKLFPALPEGVNTVHSVHQIIKNHGLVLPICAGVYQVLFKGLSVKELVARLMKNICQDE